MLAAHFSAQNAINFAVGEQSQAKAGDADKAAQRNEEIDLIESNLGNESGSFEPNARNFNRFSLLTPEPEPQSLITVV